MTAVLIGADPELFAFDKKLGHYVSVHNLLEGDKKNPMPVKDGAVQVDGTAAEFNITAAKTVEEFCNRIALVKQNIEGIIQKRNPNVILVSQPWVEYGKDYWDTVPEANKELGCDPDFNAYTGEPNPRPDPVKIGRPSLRTGSGHVHIGWTKGADVNSKIHLLDCMLLVRSLDKHLLPVIEKYFDKDTVRRELYGKPGAFRPKPYGVEYRVLSNVWVTNPDATKIVYLVSRAITMYLLGSNHTVHGKVLNDANFKFALAYYCVRSEREFLKNYGFTLPDWY